jgi:hypothetical protein
MLRITKSTDPIEVKTITCCIYAVPGVGKSTLGFTANKPLLLDFDHGSYRAGNRGDTVQINAWADVTSIAADDLKAYGTLIIDTAGRALDFLTVDIIERNPKMGRGGALTLQGYGELKSQFIAWTKLVRGMGLDVLLIAHSDEQRKGEDIIERLDVQGSSKNEIYKSADSMGRIYLAGNKRMLNFSPTDIAFGKNPANLPPLEIPHYAQEPSFLGTVLDRIKAELNKQSAVQKQAGDALTTWKAKIDKLTTADDFNKMLAGDDKPGDLVKSDVKRMMGTAARKKGITFDTKAGAFVAIERGKAA